MNKMKYKRNKRLNYFKQNCPIFRFRHRGEGGAGGALAPPLFWLIKLLFQFFSKVLHKKVHRVILCQTFSSARRLKTWLRSTITQTRFSNLTILNTHKQRTDNLCLIDIANEFTALNDNRRKNFGTFKESDFKISG